MYSLKLLSADHKATVCDNVFCGFCIFQVIFVVLGWREISGGDILPSKQVWETYVHASYNTGGKACFSFSLFFFLFNLDID